MTKSDKRKDIVRRKEANKQKPKQVRKVGVIRNPLADCLFCLFTELLARLELVIVFFTLLQAFGFTLPEGVNEANTKLGFGSTTNPPPYQLCAIPQ